LTWPTALPVAALRVLRTAAGRRALRLAVLVGGLFTLGFLCGEQAHAAEGTPLATSASVTSSVVVPADPVPPPLTDGVVRSLGDRVVRPVGGLVETVTAELGNVTARIPPLSSSPGLPSVPSAPDLPVPGQTQTRPTQTQPTPVPHAPQPDRTEQSATGGSAEGARSRAQARASATPYGPRAGAGLGGASRAAMAQPARPRVTGPAVVTPAGHAPYGTPTGALSATSTVGDGTPRHGDGHAVPLNHRAPLRLVPCEAVRPAAAETRDRHRDIPVPPG